MARHLTPIQPDLTLAKTLKTTRIPRLAGLISGHTAVVTTRPFRAPHHTISDVATPCLAESEPEQLGRVVPSDLALILHRRTGKNPV